MFHVGIGGSGKTTFVDWIKAAVTEVYYHDLPISAFDKMWTAYKSFSELAPSVRFLFAPELDATPKYASASSERMVYFFATLTLFVGM